MKHEEYPISVRGRPMFAQSWAPEARARGVVALVHGFGEHSGRYAHVAERFAAAGYLFAAVDLPGHGRSPGKQGDTSVSEILCAVGTHVEETKHRWPGLPLILYGHSLGGAMVLRFGWESRPAIAGVIATSPLIALAAGAPAWKISMARMLKTLAPSLILTNPLDLPSLSRDPAIGEAAAKDPLYHNKVSTRLGYDIMQLEPWFQAVKGAFPLPLLVMLGTADRIVQPGATIALAGRLNGATTLKRWEGFYHELHNEPEKDRVLDAMIAWMNERT